MTGTGTVLGRRELLAGGLLLPLGAATCRRLPPIGWAPRLYADMHVHLFNAHDLPVGRFLLDVIFREQALPRPLKAVIDYLLRRAQSLAISAKAERRLLNGAAFAAARAGARTPEGFAADFAAWAGEGAHREPPWPSLFIDATERRAGYDELLDAVLADAPGGILTAEQRLRSTAPGPARTGAVQHALADLARRAESAAAPAPSGMLQTPLAAADSGGGCPSQACPPHGYSLSFAAILRYLGWAYLMLQSREFHLVKYLDLAAAHSERPTALLNHLVDYDAWLGVDRLPGSSHLEQIETAVALAARYRDKVELATFAGFCPLKHALERLGGVTPTLVRLLALAGPGPAKVTGFKLYPPMGFRPLGNAELPNSAFDPRSDLRSAYFRAWSANFGGGPDGRQIGEALDASLDAFYATCAARGLPLMAHAGPGNQAGPDFGQRANPLHWREVARRHRLRISLGHIVNSAEDFVCAVERNERPPCVWALDASPGLLDPGSGLRAEVYGDLAYMPELIASETLATRFFVALRKVFGDRDPKLSRILYGSDYVMLGTMQDYGAHLSAMRRAMAKAGYDGDMVENILVRNALRFRGQA
jgi:hypothetical protein